MVKKQTTCGVKGCEEEHKTMADLYKHQITKHEELVKKYSCNVRHHAHISADSRRKCLNRTTVKTPKECLWRAKANQVKKTKDATTNTKESVFNNSESLLNRLPETRAEFASILDACFE